MRCQVPGETRRALCVQRRHPGADALMRAIRTNIDGLLKDEMHAMSLAVAHSVSRYRVKFNPEKIHDDRASGLAAGRPRQGAQQLPDARPRVVRLALPRAQ
ncbi:hypothetical protein L596_010633 [Steinernema carpocapsae]|uniref:Uncharacterized protein n=1 Tax=Steinernema carpocapsae TaxID=34508 RepID=A0A4U5PJ19_STECR|nr:hypothetical protein L596_010633 [Steinernema carpocapsae]